MPQSVLQGGQYNVTPPAPINGEQVPLQVDSAGNLKTTATASLTINSEGSPTGGAAGTKSSMAGGVFNTVAPTLTNGQQVGLQVDVSGNLKTTASLAINTEGSVGAGTAATKSALGGGVFNTAAPTLTNGQQAALQVDSSGNLKTTATLAINTEGPVAPGTSATKSTLSGGVFNTVAPTLTNGQQAALQVNASGAQKVDGSGVTQPVSGTFFQGTQPVSGTFFQATQPISAVALPLPAGAALATNQSSVIGTKAAGTAATNSLLNGGVYNATPPVLTDGQQAALQVDFNGNTKTASRTQDGAGTPLTSTLINGKQRLDVALAAGAVAGGTLPAYMDLIGGSDGANARPLLTDMFGRLGVNVNGDAGNADYMPLVVAELRLISEILNEGLLSHVRFNLPSLRADFLSVVLNGADTDTIN